MIFFPSRVKAALTILVTTGLQRINIAALGGCYDSIKALIYNKLLRKKVELIIRKTFNLIAYAG